MLRLALLLALAVAPVAATPGFAQSFDCAKATQPDEKAVCANPALSREDSEMGRIYDQIMKCALMGTRGDTRDSQRTFLDERSQCGADIGCLQRLYTARISTLKSTEEGVGKGAC